MIQLPDGRWVRTDNLQPVGYRSHMPTAAMERNLTEAMCFVIPQLDEAKRALARSTVEDDQDRKR